MNEEQIEKLRQILKENFSAPGAYLFKFIVPNNNQSLARVMNLFDNSALIQKRESGKGNYVAVSAEEYMLDAESIIEKYKLAAEIEGLISL